MELVKVLGLLFLLLGEPKLWAERSSPEFSRFRELTLDLGEVKELKLGLVSRVNLSRKGVVLLSQVSTEVWRVIGHRKGHVLLSFRLKESQEESSVLVEVMTKKKVLAPPLLSPLCQFEGARCYGEPLRVEGEIKEWKPYFLLKTWCAKEKFCLFSATLSLDAQRSLSKFLETRMSSMAQCELDTQGLRLCELSCGEKVQVTQNERRRFLDLLASQGITTQVPLLCEKFVKPKSYDVFAQVLLTTESHTQKKGFSQRLMTDFIQGDFLFEPKLLKNLKLNEDLSKLEIVGSPQLFVQEGKASESRTGGELALVRETPSGREATSSTHWKAYGLSFEVKVQRAGKEKVSAAYSLSLSSPSEGNSRLSLKGVRIKGEALISLGKAKLMGSTKYKREKKGNSSQMILSSIPLIAPLFRLGKKEESESEMHLILRVEEAKE